MHRSLGARLRSGPSRPAGSVRLVDIVEVEGTDGILSFDGRVLEFFLSGDRSGAWRIHAAHVIETEIEQRKGMVLFKAYTTKRHYHGAVVPDERLVELEHLRAGVDARRR